MCVCVCVPSRLDLRIALSYKSLMTGSRKQLVRGRRKVCGGGGGGGGGGIEFSLGHCTLGT